MAIIPTKNNVIYNDHNQKYKMIGYNPYIKLHDLYLSRYDINDNDNIHTNRK